MDVLVPVNFKMEHVELNRGEECIVMKNKK
jgi:hypothetical protein